MVCPPEWPIRPGLCLVDVEHGEDTRYGNPKVLVRHVTAGTDASAKPENYVHGVNYVLVELVVKLMWPDVLEVAVRVKSVRVGKIFGVMTYGPIDVMSNCRGEGTAFCEPTICSQ